MESAADVARQHRRHRRLRSGSFRLVGAISLVTSEESNMNVVHRVFQHVFGLTWKFVQALGVRLEGVLLLISL